MKYLFLSYYFTPDIGAGSFRSQIFIDNFIKEILTSEDELYVISSSPNRYDKNLNVNNYLLSKDRRVKYIKINVYNHKERLLLKIVSGIKYFIFSIFYIMRIKPNVCISSTARTISGLAIYLPSIFLKYVYFIDLRDLFSEVLNDMMSKNFFNRIIISILKKVEYKVFKSAISINFVSPGFQEFFISNNIRFKEISLFTNGLDDIFNKENNVTFVNSIKKILYVGNIGEGQGLHNFIPEVAHELREIEFILVGDGGKKKELEENLKKKNINNVKILKPRLQTELINIYKNTDILLLNLNNFNSLKYVIPSKIFEYASFNKPIIAGVDGYTKKFCKKFNNITFFEPSNPKNFIKILNELSKKLPIKTLSNHSYLIEFQRSLLMRKYVMYIKQKLYEKNYYSI